jgi:hypothetical protein
MLLIVILTILLVGCQTQTRNSIPTLNLPPLPLMSESATNEFKKLCIPDNKCDNLNNWLNELYLFKLKYDIYLIELSK